MRDKPAYPESNVTVRTVAVVAAATGVTEVDGADATEIPPSFVAVAVNV